MNEFISNIGIGDLATLIAGIGGYFTLRAKVSELETRRKEAEATYKEEVMSAKHSRNGIRKECQENVRELRQDLKEYVNKTEEEFKSINNGMSEVKADIKGMSGKIDIILERLK